MVLAACVAGSYYNEQYSWSLFTFKGLEEEEEKKEEREKERETPVSFFMTLILLK